MLGERLKRANKIASKRASRRDYGYYYDLTKVGLFRKWNGTCGCTMCTLSRPRYKDKGFNKRQHIVQTR